MSGIWSRRPCLVTGGAGFGGAYLCRELLALGARVYVFDLHVANNSLLRLCPEWGADVEFVQGDVRDLDRLMVCLQRLEIRTVFHLAAQPVVPISNQAPIPTLMTNAVGTYNALEASRCSPFLEEFVLASSGAYYGTTLGDEVIGEEAAPLPATNIYAPSKVAADAAAQSYALAFGMKVGICRFMNSYGPGDTNFSRLIPRAIRNLIEEDPFDFGDRDDGSTELDFLHVSDMARAYVRVAECADDHAGLAFNFGSGEAYSIRRVADMVSRAFDGEAREARFSGPKRSKPIKKRLDVGRARDLLGWTPRHMFEPGIGETVRWYRDNWNRI